MANPDTGAVPPDEKDDRCALRDRSAPAAFHCPDVDRRPRREYLLHAAGTLCFDPIALKKSARLPHRLPGHHDQAACAVSSL